MSNKLKQKNIPYGWRLIKLASIFNFKNGLNKEKKYFGQGTPIINYMDVNRGGGLRTENILGRVDVNESELKRFDVKRGDVFFTRTSETINEIGFSAVALDNFKDTVFSGFVLRARPKENFFIPEYAQFCFKTQSARKEIMEKSSYTTRALTSGTLLNHVNIILPSLLEQKRIVAVLEAWDLYLEKLRRKIEIKKNIKKGLMQQLLTGRRRFKGFKEPWQKVSLCDIGNIISGGTPSKKIADFWNGTIPWISSSDLIEDDIRKVKIDRYITKEAITNSATRIIPKNSIIIVSRVGLGKVIVNKMDICTSQDFQSVVIDNSRSYNVHFLGYLLSRKMKEFLHKNQGTSIKGVLKKDLESLVVLIPKVEEQIAISDFLIKADEEIDLLEQKRKVAATQKKFLLNNLINGRIRSPEKIKV